MNKCDQCGFLHYRTDPCRKPKKSTAARKDVRGLNAGSFDAPYLLQGSLETAGTQALPVDTTNAESPNGRATDFDSVCVGSTPASASKLPFDKTAYQRNYVARWRRGEVGRKHKK